MYTIRTSIYTNIYETEFKFIHMFYVWGFTIVLHEISVRVAMVLTSEGAFVCRIRIAFTRHRYVTAALDVNKL